MFSQTQSQSPDPFDPVRLRLSASAINAAGIRRVLTALPVHKPSREAFVRVHPSDDYRLDTCVIELKDSDDVYLVDPALWGDLEQEATFGARTIVTAMARDGTLFLWPLRLAGPDGRMDLWASSALEAASLATQNWTRISALKSVGAYETVVATCKISEPEWPTMPFADLLRVAFKDKFIDSLDHPVLKRLRGEI